VPLAIQRQLPGLDRAHGHRQPGRLGV